MSDEIKPRKMAMIDDKVLAVSIPPGEKIFDSVTGKLLGIVMDGKPVINGNTCYLSTNDYETAKRAIPRINRAQTH